MFTFSSKKQKEIFEKQYPGLICLPENVAEAKQADEIMKLGEYKNGGEIGISNTTTAQQMPSGNKIHPIAQPVVQHTVQVRRNLKLRVELSKPKKNRPRTPLTDSLPPYPPRSSLLVLRPPLQQPTVVMQQVNPQPMVQVDVNGDGIPDMVVTQQQAAAMQQQAMMQQQQQAMQQQAMQQQAMQQQMYQQQQMAQMQAQAQQMMQNPQQMQQMMNQQR
ncbi:hypothetical protein TL16_g09001 [Triparma laevis f. inornata]|uniref:Uncharacterized protein n=1 Tax=Triparma laevis f. inornata TaxID=1714386 RepID=A0A9W7B3X9_9STRA|nr:hypothetical protein TL16_g09001 [Triparma laevis f. inornata]